MQTRDERGKTKTKVMVEYVLIADVNDSDEVAAELGELLKGEASSSTSRVLFFAFPILWGWVSAFFFYLWERWRKEAGALSSSLTRVLSLPMPADRKLYLNVIPYNPTAIPENYEVCMGRTDWLACCIVAYITSYLFCSGLQCLTVHAIAPHFLYYYPSTNHIILC